MTISFKPALGETLHIPILLPPLTSAIPLQFYAKLSIQDYDALKLKGAKLQLWSDIVSSNWSSLDFQHVEEDTWTTGSFSDVATVSLIDPGVEEHQNKRKLMVLQFSVSVPPQGIGPFSSDFSFTYRLFYPNGDITWLGDYQHDGNLILDYNGVSHYGFSLRQGWSRDRSGDGGVYTLNDYVEDKEIAELDIPLYYRAWAISKDNFLSGTTNASLLFLVPHAHKLSLVLTQTCVLCSTPDVTISLSDDHLITATGRGQIFLWIYNMRLGNMSAFMDKIRTCFLPEMGQLLVAKPDTGHLLLVSPVRHNIVAAVIIPLAPDGCFANTRVTIALEVLSMPLRRTQFAVFCPLNPDVHFFTWPSASETENIVSFIVAAHGSQFSMSAVADLGTAHGRSWKASLLTPYSNSRFSTDDALPTPPLSPILRTIVQLGLESESLTTSVTRQEHVPTTFTDPSRTLIVRPNESNKRHAALAALKYMVALMTAIFILVLSLIWKRPPRAGRNETGARETTADRDKGILGSRIGNSPESGAEIVVSESGTASNASFKNAKVNPPSGQSTFYAEVPGSTVVIAVHVKVDHSTSALRAEDVSKMVELNGHSPECTVRKHPLSRADTAEQFLLEFEGGKGGWIKISPVTPNLTF